jgi:hypothetical protein
LEESIVKRTALLLPLLLCALAATLVGQSSSTSSDQPAPGAKTTKAAKKAEVPMRPFSRFALGGGISLMGVNLEAATNLERHLNLNGKANFATAGVSLDYYPFPTHGFRLSPGAMLYNQNGITANAIGTAGSDISLNQVKYYADTATGVTPLTMNGSLGLNAHKQAFTMTTGWGNMIPRKGGHWSFPFELGAAFTGVPTIDVGLKGSACTVQSDAAINGESCVDMSTNTGAISDLNSQIAKWKSDLSPAQVYPILSFGVSYAFHTK